MARHVALIDSLGKIIGGTLSQSVATVMTSVVSSMRAAIVLQQATDGWTFQKAASSFGDTDSGTALPGVAIGAWNGSTFTPLRTADAAVASTGVLKVEQKYSYSAVAVVDTQVKATAGFLHTVTISCNDAAPTAGTLIIYDSASETGTVVFNHTFTTTPFVPFTVLLDYTMGTGIYCGLTTTGDVNFSVSYR